MTEEETNLQNKVMVEHLAPLCGAKKIQQICCNSVKTEVVYSAENLQLFKHKSRFHIHVTSAESHGGKSY